MSRQKSNFMEFSLSKFVTKKFLCYNVFHWYIRICIKRNHLGQNLFILELKSVKLIKVWPKKSNVFFHRYKCCLECFTANFDDRKFYGLNYSTKSVRSSEITDWNNIKCLLMDSCSRIFAYDLTD
ncbi:hypothetical protein BpHYR1_005416 [Brachionus plicatilis]|uniref:Uncharacterized protein n=1 Tax=Brachionus plicatilis TaxID=10195 RepID=A0A3M7Q8U4_BRAPC|nr:hypothetical protein BpHYR1_005416 [Brachionus plicatilis]